MEILGQVTTKHEAVSHGHRKPQKGNTDLQQTEAHVSNDENPHFWRNEPNFRHDHRSHVSIHSLHFMADFIWEKRRPSIKSHTPQQGCPGANTLNENTR